MIKASFGLPALFAGLVVALAAQAEQTRVAAGWIAMVESCMSYAETGRRSEAFGTWQIAADNGNDCDGGPACEDDNMTFVAPVEMGFGAVTVTVGAADWAALQSGSDTDRTVADFARHLSCVSEARAPHTVAAILSLHEPLVKRAVQSGRLVEAGVFAGVLSGPYLGCGHDGRPYQIEFALPDTGAAKLRLYHPAREGGAEGLTPACEEIVS